MAVLGGEGFESVYQSMLAPALSSFSVWADKASWTIASHPRGAAILAHPLSLRERVGVRGK